MFFALVSSFAVAAGCPNLSGTFSCPDDGNSPAYEMTVSQKELANDEIEYTYSSTNGNSHTMIASESGVTSTDNSFLICINDALVIRRNRSETYHKVTPEDFYTIVGQQPGGRSTEFANCPRK